MNEIDSILGRLREQQPALRQPDELTERIMSRLPERKAPLPERQNARTLRLRWHWVACLLLLIGAGATVYLWQRDHPSQSVCEPLSQFESHKLAVLTSRTDSFNAENWQSERRELTANMVNQLPSHVGEGLGVGSVPLRARHNAAKKIVTPPPTPPLQGRGTAAPKDENLHYASIESADTAYLPPSRVDDFIAKFACYYDVPSAALRCSQQADSSVVSAVYVFPDKKEVDVIGRLLQAAVTYSDDTPGYLLNFSHQQFFFQLKDLRLQLQYLWIAERVNGKILLYSSHAPIGAVVSSACYQEYREQLMHTTKSLEL